MALEIVIAPLAKRDLEDIAATIAAENAAAAIRLVDRFEKATLLLAARPYAGARFLLQTARPLRKMSVHPYILFYRVDAGELRIVRVLHAARDLANPSLFKGE